MTETWGSTGTDGIIDTSRATSFTYDAKVRYRITETNPLGHVQTTGHDAILGLPVTTTGPNGLTTTLSYDVSGRSLLETRADATTTTSGRAFCGGAISCPTDAYFRTETLVSGGGTAQVFIDKLNREVRKQSQINGQWSIIDTQYDALGRVSQRSEPYFSGNTIYWTTIQYDLLGRPTVTTAPDTSTESVTYNGLTKISTNALGQTKTVTSDVAGRSVTVTDAASQSLSYTYDALGQMLSMSDGTITSTYAYDARGNKVSDTDPDKGTWTYRYNALGLLVEQTDAKAQMTAITFDVLGRMLSRIDDATGANPGTRTATWVYDTSTTKGIGKLHTSVSAGYSLENIYDSLGRPSSSTEIIDSTALTSSTSYDAFSRPQNIVYPSGITITNSYDANGALNLVQDDTASTTYWERQNVDARGNITEFKLGNGVETLRSYEPENGRLKGIDSFKSSTVIQELDYSFDLIGNLTQRIDTRLSQTENFQYDVLNRVVQIDTIVGSTTTNVALTYTARGNIASKSNVGDYTYGQVHGSCTSGVAGPHAVTQVASSQSSHTKTAIYCYDANGNMTSGDGRTVTYSAFDKPVILAKSTNTVSITYGPERARIKRVDQTASTTTTTLYASGKMYEFITTPTETIEKHYIGNFAVITKITNTGPGSLATSYLHRDHLGSVDTITSATGTVSQRMSFDSHGKRREINWQVMSEASIFSFDTTLTTRGFTGHEMLDPVGLVHMNGRVYDPELGRFLSADPNVQDATNLQSWNRYSYVLNNPLSYTDPSGFFFSKIFKSIGSALSKAFSAIGAILKKALQIPLIRAAIQIAACATAYLCAPVTAAITLVSGGSITDAIKAGAFAFVQMGVWTGVGIALESFASLGTAAFAAVKGAIHGVVGGALSLAQGGNFIEGFVANAIGGAVGVITSAKSALGSIVGDAGVALRTAISAVAGCASASLTGGKCANGALTAAFAHLYNQEAHSECLTQCHGNTGSPGRTMTDNEQLGLDAATFLGTGGVSLGGIRAFFSLGIKKIILISRGKYGDAADHIADAQLAGYPDVLTIARGGASANRKASIGGLSKVSGKQLDEYPPAMFREGGAGASVRPVNPRNNMGAGACIGNSCRSLSNGDKVRIKVVN